MRRFAIAVVSMALMSAGCDVAVSGLSNDKVVREDKRFTVTGKPQLELRTFDGSIDVRTGSGSEVLLTIERRGPTEDVAKALEVTTEQKGDHLSIVAKQPNQSGGIHFGSRGAVSFVLTVPPNADIEARSGDGSIRVQGVTGTLQTHTGDGSIKLTDINGPVDVSSGDGSIAVAGKMAAVHARSGDGSVNIDASPGTANTGDWDVTTGDGSVTLRLPSDFNADFDAHTGDGGIRVRDIELSHVSGEMGKNDLRGTIGNGGRRVHVRTGDGSITLRRD